VAAKRKLSHFIMIVMESKKPWYNYWNPPYKGDEPAFSDLSGNPVVQAFEDNAAQFHKELLELLRSRSGSLIDHYASGMYDPGGWSTISLKTWGIDVPANLEACPAIHKFLLQHPQVLSFSVNQLKPGKTIKPHCGDTNAIWRCHAGLEIPAGLPECGFRVGEAQRPWVQYKVFGFCDAYEHEAWNHSTGNRLIICFDLIRETFKDQAKPVSLNVRAFLVLQYLATKMPFLLKMPKQANRVLFLALKILLYVMYPYQRRRGVIIKHS